MILWWIGNAVLLLVVLPVVVYLLRGVLDAARSIVPSVQQISAAAAAGSRTSMRPRSCSRRRTRCSRRSRSLRTTAAPST